MRVLFDARPESLCRVELLPTDAPGLSERRRRALQRTYSRHRPSRLPISEAVCMPSVHAFKRLRGAQGKRQRQLVRRSRQNFQ